MIQNNISHDNFLDIVQFHYYSEIQNGIKKNVQRYLRDILTQFDKITSNGF